MIRAGRQLLYGVDIQNTIESATTACGVIAISEDRPGGLLIAKALGFEMKWLQLVRRYARKLDSVLFGDECFQFRVSVHHNEWGLK